MATITHKMKKGRPYYYAVQCARVEGKPRIVWQKYLGTVEAIVARTESAKPPKPKEAVLFEAGGVAGLSRIAQRLGLMDLINEAAPKRDQSPSVGHYIVLAALNRALSPCSELAIGDWYEQTVLRRLWRFDKTAFSSQRFWDHMLMVTEDAIEAIQTALVGRVRREFGLDAEVLLYDTTNFFTFLATANDRCTVAQRGHDKAKRHDLRQVGLALLVTRDFQVPLFHKVYDGNIPDASLFPALAKELIARHRAACGAKGQATPSRPPSCSCFYAVCHSGCLRDHLAAGFLTDPTPPPTEPSRVPSTYWPVVLQSAVGRGRGQVPPPTPGNPRAICETRGIHLTD